MNTDRLAKHYASLTPAERLSLLMAAAARGDEEEAWWRACEMARAVGMLAGAAGQGDERRGGAR